MGVVGVKNKTFLGEKTLESSILKPQFKIKLFARIFVDSFFFFIIEKEIPAVIFLRNMHVENNVSLATVVV